MTPLCVRGSRSSGELRSLPEVTQLRHNRAGLQSPGLLMRGQMVRASLSPKVCPGGQSPQLRGGATSGAGPPVTFPPRPAKTASLRRRQTPVLSSHCFSWRFVTQGGTAGVCGRTACPWAPADSCALLCHSAPRSHGVGRRAGNQGQGSGRLGPAAIPSCRERKSV